MKSEFDEVAYELENELYHFEDYSLDWKEDLSLEEFPSYDEYKIYDTKPFEAPKPIIYSCYAPITPYIDYPVTDNDWTVMSRKMYEALLSAGDFAHRLYDLAVVDWRVMKKDWYDENGEMKKTAKVGDYVLMQISEYADVFDYEKSKYKLSADSESRLHPFENVEEYVFKVPPQGLPPLFRIPEERIRLFISSEGRGALKRANISGTAYLSLQGYSKIQSDEVDVPIKIPKEALM